jgi:allantoicase
MAFKTAGRSGGSGPGPHEPGEPLVAEADLASRWVGGSVLAASDESFGDKENLLNPNAAAFEPGHYGNRGEIVDGWETKRRREPGHDWALIRLGTPGVVTSVDVDTSFFTGNFPESCVVEACGCEGYPSPAELNDPATDWVEIVHESPLRGDSHNIFPVLDSRRFTHVRLSAFPDGGIARLRVLGEAVLDPRDVDGLTIDLASQELGGAVVLSSDGFYTSAQMLNRPDRARTMGEGWETRRRRDSGHDFVEFRLAFPGRLQQLVIDTAHFKYNASAEVAVYGCSDEARPLGGMPDWVPLLARTRLQPDTRHVFPVISDVCVAFVRLEAFPDGGLSRFRAIGAVDQEARRAAGYRWFNSLPLAQAVACLREEGVSGDVASSVAGQRPLTEEWLEGVRGRVAAGTPGSGEEACSDLLTRLLEGVPRVGSEVSRG